MPFNKTVFLPLILMIVFIHMHCNQQFSPLQNLSLYMPVSGQIEGWQRERDMHSYRGEDLFQYINGGAEIYHEYGFEQVVVQDYKNEQNRSLSVEIYEMITPAAAYGIYTFKKSAEGTPLEVEAEGRMEGYYLNFWKGPYLVTITGFDEEDETIAGVKSIAGSIASSMSPAASGQKPNLVKSLPRKGLIPGSEKYFKGILGMFNSYPFSRQDIFNLKEAVKGDYDAGYSLFIIEYQDASESGAQLKAAEESLREDPKYLNFGLLESSVYFSDDKGKLLYFTAMGKYMVIVLGAENIDAARSISLGIPLHTAD